jgi:hypothetical protein
MYIVFMTQESVPLICLFAIWVAHPVIITPSDIATAISNMVAMMGETPFIELAAYAADFPPILYYAVTLYINYPRLALEQFHLEL